MKFSIDDLFSKCDQIRSFLRSDFLCSVTETKPLERFLDLASDSD